MKRRIDEFGQMVAAKTDRSPFDFNGYGNWCGLGGSGETVDEIDRYKNTILYSFRLIEYFIKF